MNILRRTAPSMHTYFFSLMILLAHLHLPLCGTDNRIFVFGAQTPISQKLIVSSRRRFMRFAWAFSDHYCYAKHTLIVSTRCIAENRQMIIIVKNTRDFSTAAVAVAALMSRRRRERKYASGISIPCVTEYRYGCRSDSDAVPMNGNYAHVGH